MSSLSISDANRIATDNGHYHYNNTLGCGGFGQVLEATDCRSNVRVAIKLIPARRSYFIYTTVEDGKKEADLLSSLHHDNIVAIRDHFEFQEGLIFTTHMFAIVMEYCSKGSLQTHLQILASQQKRVPNDKRHQWYQQLASALEYTHSKGIAHRDLKPANVLLNDADNLKVADVGIAKAVYDEMTPNGSIQSYMQTVCGTLPYMAPEVFKEHYTKKSDVFSMGLVMFVICELPVRSGRLEPIAYLNDKQCYLGEAFRECNKEKATTLLGAKHCPPNEKELFDDMLHFDYNTRLTAGNVVERVKYLR